MRALFGLLVTTSFVVASPLTEIESVTLQRRGCFGPCPVYSLEIRCDGTVRYSGTKGVETVGERSSKISKEAFRQIVSKLQQMKFFALDDGPVFTVEGGRVPAFDIDGSSSIITAVTPDTRKTVTYYLEAAPEPLIQLEQLIEWTCDSARWIKQKS